MGVIFFSSLWISQLWGPWGETQFTNSNNPYALQNLVTPVELNWEEYGPTFLGHLSWQSNSYFQAPYFFARVGNEIGDQMLWELVDKKKNQNHTPHMEFDYSSKNENWLWGLSFLQPDHMSDGQVQYRIKRAGGKPWEVESFDKRAWFGENYPHLSKIAGSVGYQNERQKWVFEPSLGWEWMTNPWTQRQTPFWIQKYNLDMAEKEGATSLQVGRYADVSKDSLSQHNYAEAKYRMEWGDLEIGAHLFASQNWIQNEESINWGVGPLLHWKQVYKRNEFQLDWQANFSRWKGFASYSYSWGNWIWNHKIGVEMVEAKSFSISGLERVQGALIEEGWESYYSAKEIRGLYTLPFRTGGTPQGHTVWEFKLCPGFERNRLIFDADSFRLIENEITVNDRDGYWEREGVFRETQNFYPFLNVLAKVRIRPVYFLQWETKLHWHVEGESESDFVEPLFLGESEVSVLFPFELRFMVRNRIHSGYSIAKVSSYLFTSGWVSTLDLGLLQYLYKRKFQMDVRLLNAFGEEIIVHPNASPERFRLLASVRFFW